MNHPKRIFRNLALALAGLGACAAQPAGALAAEPPRIQMAILLDTSNSMDGLIDQTRNQLWQVVNEFSTARRDGEVPLLEIALFEYGNDGISAQQGHVRKRVGFTRELDRVSEGLFALTTNGGSEYCGYAIQRALDELQWSRSDADIKTIFIAGNEAFTQGPVAFRDAITAARRQDITVNTIHAGSYRDGIAGGWQSGAILAGGDYMSIDANRRVTHIDAPQDAELAELNARLNQTYVPYGDKGAASAARQQEQDQRSSQVSPALLAERVRSKALAYYDNPAWDLVDALTGGAMSEETITALEPEALPAEIRALGDAQKLDYLRRKAAERQALQQRIAELAAAREIFVAEKKRALTAAAPSIGDALSAAVRKEAARKRFTLGQ